MSFNSWHSDKEVDVLRFNWRVVYVTLMFVSLGGMPGGNIGIANGDFNNRLFVQLSHMMNVAPPTRVTVDIVPPQELIGWYRGELFRECMDGRLLDELNINVFNCRIYRQSFNGFIYGRWIKEEDRGHLHVVFVGVGGQEGVSLETKIHEWVHWYLYYLTKNPGLMNTEELTKQVAVQLLTSHEFLKWLK